MLQKKLQRIYNEICRFVVKGRKENEGGPTCKRTEQIDGVLNTGRGLVRTAAPTGVGSERFSGAGRGICLAVDLQLTSPWWSDDVWTP